MLDSNRSQRLKRKRLSKKNRISELPNAILSHILSYIPTKQSVSTSILSKRWRYVWTFVPVIDIDDSLISEPDLQDISYNRFVNNVFNLFQADLIDKFSLKSSRFDKFRVNELVLSATKRKVLELDLCITKISYSMLPIALFAYKELVALKLKFGDRYVCVDVPRTLCFPSLKKLHLYNAPMEFPDEDSINNLLSACPVLEDLHLERGVANKLKVLNVNAHALKFLTITIYAYDSEDHSHYKVILDTPKLEVLKYKGHLPQEGFCFKNVPTQIEAYIDVKLYIPEETIHFNIPPGVFELARGISNSKTLHLTDHSLEALSILDVNDLPIFDNLTKLLLDGSESCGKLLPHLLKNSPNLEVLILTDLEEEFECITIIDVPECQSRHLKVVQILGRYHIEDLHKFETYIRLSAKNLKEFTVFLPEQRTIK